MSDESSQKKILIVETSQSAFIRYSQAVKDDNREIERALSGKEAIAKAISLAPDLMIIEMNLPDVNGIDVIEQIRSFTSDMQSIVAMKDIPVITLVDKNIDNKIKKRANVLGGVIFVTKPINSTSFQQLVNKTLENQYQITDKVKILLVVDPEPRVRTYIKNLIGADMNIQVVTAENGLGALEMIEFNRPDIIMTELSLPDIDGFELLTSLQEVASDIPIIIVSSDSKAESIQRAKDLGAKKFITKPFIVDELIQTVNNLLFEHK